MQPKATVAPDVWRHALAIRRLYDLALRCADEEEDEDEQGQEERPDTLIVPADPRAPHSEGEAA